MASLHRYITPLIYPVFSDTIGMLAVGLDLQTVIDRTTPKNADFDLQIVVEVFAEGEMLSTESVNLTVRNGAVSEPFFMRRFHGEGLGYAEISVRADRPVFSSLNLSVGYGLLSRPGFGTVNVLHDEKFASPAVIQQIKEIGRFCLLHPACLWDTRRNAGNSFLLINPYGKPLLARLSSNLDRHASQRVPARSARMMPLEPLLDDGRHGTVMLTSANRFPVWDVRHAADDPAKMFNIDHLEVYRGAQTHEYVNVRKFARAGIRRILRETHVRII